MRLLLVLVLVAGSAWAQRAPGGVTNVGVGGFGNVNHPGSGSAPVYVAPGFAAQYGASIAGTPASGARRLRQQYGTPVYYGGGYGGYGGYYDSGAYGYGQAVQYQPAQQQAPNITIVNEPAQAPTVIINQNFGPPPETTHISGPSVSATSAPASPEVRYFLVAFKDHSVNSALAYWIEDKTLHYVTPQQTHNQASVDLVDLELTKTLNQR